MRMDLRSWNVNGIRAASGKEDWRWFTENPAQVLALQEVKATPEQVDPALAHPEGRHAFWNPCQVKKGYSGVAVFSSVAPVAAHGEPLAEEWRGEGRLIHLEFENFHFFNGYFPNGGAEILDEAGKPTGAFKRVPYKMGFFEDFLRFAEECRRTKPVVVCGDFNIAHREIDLARPKQNTKCTGFLPEERAFLDRFSAAGYLDTFRLIHGDEPDRYTWWSYKSRAREKNIGWRIDYFFVSEELRSNVADAWIEADVFGSDHCPVGLALEF